MRYSLVFPFSEINAAVFQNASIFLRRISVNDYFSVFCPEELASLYFHANEIVEVSHPEFNEYSEVSNYVLPPFIKKNPSTWWSPQLINHLKQSTLNRLPTYIFNKFPERFTADYKMRKYLFQTGIYDFCVSNVPQNHVFLGTARNLDLVTMQNLPRPSIVPWDLYFKNLSEMILQGGLSTHEVRSQLHAAWEAKIRDRSQIAAFQSMKSFIEENPHCVYIRTRNIAGAASVHNTNRCFLENLVQAFLSEGYSVLSTGTPTISLEISNPLYLEVSHSLPVATQQWLASQCKFIVTSAEAGLFTAWASSNLPLVTFGREWSLHNTISQISLSKSRLEVGVRDIEIGDLSEYGDLKKFVSQKLL